MKTLYVDPPANPKKDRLRFELDIGPSWVGVPDLIERLAAAARADEVQIDPTGAGDALVDFIKSYKGVTVSAVRWQSRDRA